MKFRLGMLLVMASAILPLNAVKVVNLTSQTITICPPQGMVDGEVVTMRMTPTQLNPGCQVDVKRSIVRVRFEDGYIYCGQDLNFLEKLTFYEDDTGAISVDRKDENGNVVTGEVSSLAFNPHIN